MIEQDAFRTLRQRIVVGLGFRIRGQFSLEPGHLTQHRIIGSRATLLTFNILIISTLLTKSKALVAFERIEAQLLENLIKSFF